VGSSGEIEGALVGQMTRTGVEQLIHQCGVVRRGEQLRAPRQPPAHLEESTAVIVVHSDRFGDGSLSRSPYQTCLLADFLDYAERELRRLRQPE
jgi:hypothetical protein